MYVKKTTRYVIGVQNDSVCPAEKESSNQPYRVFKTGRVLTLKEERESWTKKSADIASIANQGFDYYQVTSNQGACEKCEEHIEAIYPVAKAKDMKLSRRFIPTANARYEDSVQIIPIMILGSGKPYSGWRLCMAMGHWNKRRKRYSTFIIGQSTTFGLLHRRYL